MEGPLGDTRSPCRSTLLHASGAPCRSRTAARGYVDPVLHSQALTLHFLSRSLHPSPPPCSLFPAPPAVLLARTAMAIGKAHCQPLLSPPDAPAQCRGRLLHLSCPPSRFALRRKARPPWTLGQNSVAARVHGQTASAGRGLSWKSPRPRAGSQMLPHHSLFAIMPPPVAVGCFPRRPLF
jgi:hypothetical protein